MTPPSSAFSLPSLKQLSSSGLLRPACVFLLFVSIFSGRFSFVRFADEFARADWLQLRFWFTALAALGWVVLHRLGGEVQRGVDKQLVVWLSLVAVFYACVLVNTLALGDPISAPQHVTDIVITAIQVFLIIQIVRSEADLVWFARIAEVLAVVLFLFCMAGFGNPDLNGAGWAPFGGPITFYRIQFLAFCCALYLFARGRGRATFFHLLVAAIGLFSALASLSKVALVGSLVAVAVLVFGLLSTRRWSQALVVGLTVGLTLLAFTYLRGEILAARVNEAVEKPRAGVLNCEVPAAERNWAIGVIRRIQSGEAVRLADLPAWQQRCIRALVSGDAEKRPLAAILEDLSRMIIYQDRTGRARLWAHAWELFRSSPWFGVGIGNYGFEEINQYTKEIQLYRYPHNIVLELAATMGAIGLSLFALLTFISLVLLQHRVMAHPALLYAMAYPLFILVTALAGGDYFDFRVFWLFTLIVLAATARDLERPAAARGAEPITRRDLVTRLT
jgi:hypothetical protein